MLEFALGENKEYLHERITQELNKDPLKRIIVLVSEQYTLQKELDILKDIRKPGMLTLEVSSFSRLCERIVGDVPKLSNAGLSLIIYAITRENQLFCDVPPAMLLNTLSDMKRYDIDLNGIDQTDLSIPLREKLNQLSVLQSKVKEKTQGLYDSVDLLNEAIQRVPSCHLFEDCLIIVDGFDMLTSQIKRFLCALIKRCDTLIGIHVGEGNDAYVYESNAELIQYLTSFANDHEIPVALNKVSKINRSEEIQHLANNLYAFPTEIFEHEPKGLKLYKHVSASLEMEFCAQEILQLITQKGYTCSEIGVISPKGYTPYLLSCLRAKNIPAHADSVRCITNSQLFVFISSLLRLASGRFNKRELFRFLFNYYANVSNEEASELLGFLSEYGLRAHVLMGNLKNEELNEIRKKAFPALELFKTMNPITALKEAFALHDIEAKTAALNSSFHTQAFDKTMEILQLAEETFSNQPLNAQELCDVLAGVLSGIDIATIPPQTNEINVGDMFHTRFAPLKVLFVLSMNEGCYSKDETGLLTDMEIAMLNRQGVGFLGVNRLNDDKLSIIHSLASASEQLYLSCIESQNQWITLLRIQKLFPQLPVFHSQAPLDQPVQQPMEPNLDKQTAKGLFPKNMSVSRLEEFAKCPFRHFLRYGLKAQPKRDYDNSAMEFGTILHTALSSMTKAYLKDGDMSESVAQAAANETLNQNKKLMENEKASYIRKYVTRQLRECSKIIATQLEGTKATVIGSEIDFSNSFNVQLKDGTVLRINGLIDRADTLLDDTFVRVIDYKLSGKKFDMNEFIYGLNIQLILYLYAIIKLFSQKENKKLLPFGVYYFDLRLPFTETGDIDQVVEQKRMTGLTLEGVSVGIERPDFVASRFNTHSILEFETMFAHVEALIETNAQRIFEGDVSIAPYSPAKGGPTCAYCDYPEICCYTPQGSYHKKKTLEDLHELYKVTKSID